MAHRDYYEILGVSREENTAGIRAAFRKLAKTHHPDRAGPEATRRFQDIAEAYCVLSNPKTRECYNVSLQNTESGVRLKVRTQTRHTPSGSPYNAYRDTENAAHQRQRDNRRERYFHASLTIDPALRQFSRPLEIEVILTRQEAEHGGILPLPLAVPCGYCRGAGGSGFSLCPQCHGRGRVEAGIIRLEMPPSLIHGTVLEYPLHGGHPDVDLLRLHVKLQS